MAIDDFGATANAIQQGAPSQNGIAPPASPTSVVRDVNAAAASAGRTAQTRLIGDQLAGLNYSSSAAGVRPPNYTTNDFLPAGDNPILKGNFSGKVVSTPIFVPSMQFPFAAAAKMAQEKQQKASAAMLRALKPIDIRKPQTKHPKFQEKLDEKFYGWLNGWEERVPNIVGGWDNLMSGRTKESMEFRKQYDSFERMRRNADFLVDRTVEIQNLENDLRFRVDKKSRQAVDDVLTSVLSFETGEFRDIAPALDRLDASVSMGHLVKPHVDLLRTEMQTILDDIEGSKGSSQWWMTATSRVEDFLSGGAVDALVRQLAMDNPHLIYSEKLEEEFDGINDEYTKGDQVYTEDDVRYYFEAIIPDRIQAQRTINNKPSKPGNVNVSVDNARKVDDTTPDYLANTLSRAITDPGNSNNAVSLNGGKTRISGGHGLQTVFRDGELVVTPTRDFDATTQAALAAMSDDGAVTGITSTNSANSSMAHLRNTSGNSQAASIWRNTYQINGVHGGDLPLEEQTLFYQNASDSLRSVSNDPAPRRLSRLVEVASIGDSGVMMTNGWRLNGVNVRSVPGDLTKSKKKQGTADAWDMTVQVDGISKTGILIPEVNIKDKAQFSTNTGGFSNFFGDKLLRQQGLSGDFMFVPDAALKMNGDGITYTIINSDGSAYKHQDQLHSGVVETGSIESFVSGNVERYADAYDAGAKSLGRQSGIAFQSDKPAGNMAVQVDMLRPTNILNPTIRNKYLDFVPNTMEDFALMLEARQWTPGGLIGNFDATRQEVVGLNNQGLGQYAVPEDFGRFLHGMFFGMNGGAGSALMKEMKNVAPYRYQETINAQSTQGGSLTFAEAYPFMVGMLTGIDNGEGAGTMDAATLSRLWAAAVQTSIDSGIGSDELGVFITNSVKRNVAR